MRTTKEKYALAAVVAVYPLRLLQLGTCTIAGYAACYLAWMHEHHYCARYGCGSSYHDRVNVPIGEVMMIVSSVLLVLEWALWAGSLAIAAHRDSSKKVLDAATQLLASGVLLLVYSIGFATFAAVPTVRATWPVCYGMWNRSIYDAPETYFCITTQNAVSTGLMTWIATALIMVLAVVEYRKDMGVGAIRLCGVRSSAATVREENGDAVSIHEVSPAEAVPAAPTAP